MTVRDLWLVSVYVGRTQFEDDDYGPTNPFLVVGEGDDSMSKIIMDNNHPYHYLANREIKYFDFIGGTMRIRIDGKKE